MKSLSLITATLFIFVTAADAQGGEHSCQQQTDAAYCTAIYTCQVDTSRADTNDPQAKPVCDFFVLDNQCNILDDNPDPFEGDELAESLPYFVYVTQLNPSADTDIAAQWGYNGSNYSATGQDCSAGYIRCSYALGNFQCR